MPRLAGHKKFSSKIPSRHHRYFTGRAEILRDLQKGFADRPGIGFPLTQLIYGLGGVGKTQVAAEYAYRFSETYSYVLWTDADSSLAAGSGFVEFASLLGLPEKNAESRADVIHAVKHWLERNDGWLLVFDNVEDPSLLKEYVPNNPRGHLLLTSRSHAFDSWGVTKSYELRVMSPDESVELLFTRTDRIDEKDEERNAAEDLANELGYLPLALDYAGAYIKETKARFRDYLTSFYVRRLELFKKPRVPENHTQAISTTWDINFQQVEKTSRVTANLLRVSAFLAPDNIPFELIAAGSNKLGAVIGSALSDAQNDPLLINEALGPLIQYSLITCDTDSRTYGVHRLVQEVLRSKMRSPIRRQWAERAVNAVAQAFPYIHGSEQWLLCERLLPHAKVALSLISDWGFVSRDAGRLANQVAHYYFKRGRYAEAEPLYRQSLAIRQQVLGEEDPEVGTSLNLLGELFRVQARYVEAEPLQERSLAIREKALGQNHPDVALTLDNLGAIYCATGRYAEAEPLFKRALSIRKKTLGMKHRKVAASFNYLAFLCHALGRFRESERLHKRALAIREHVLGPNHPHVARNLNNLALVYWAEGKYIEAEALHKRALVIRESQGIEHPDVAASLNNLASVYRDQRRYSEAAPLFQRALEIRRRVFGKLHPDVAATLHNIGLLFLIEQRYAEAMALLEEALSIREITLGSEHPYVAHTLHHLGLVYSAQGDLQKAENSFQKALAIRKRVLPEDHPDLVRTSQEYARIREAGDKPSEGGTEKVEKPT